MTEKIKPFTTDGCSGGLSWSFNTIFRKELPWRGCCVEHDKAYWKGGSREQRKTADTILMQCVSQNGYPTIAFLMYLAVRFGGHPLFPTSYRWGYGWTYPHYKEY